MPNEQGQIILFFLLISLLILALAGFIILMLFRHQEKHYNHLRSVEQIKNINEQVLLKTQLEIQESTLINISREIHDNIGLSLTLAKLNLTSDSSCSSKNISTAIELISNAIINLSNLSRTMNSEFIKNNGLVNSLKKEIENLQWIKGFSLELKIVGEPYFLDSSKELILFRIAQEAYNNALKYSKATKITTTISYEEDNLILKVEDNGVGFDYKPEFRENSGLNNILQRTKILKGYSQITSLPNLGTQVTINIPTNNLKDEFSTN